MANEYYSKLASNLYNAKDADSSHDSLQDIKEINDGYFLYPIYDAYLRFQNDLWGSSYITALSKIDSPEALELIKKIAVDSATESENFVECLCALQKFSYFDEVVLSKAQELLIKFAVGGASYFFFSDLLSYMEKAKRLKDAESFLQMIFENEKKERSDRQLALEYYIKSSPKEHVEAFTLNYSAIRGTDIEVFLVKELLGWTGTAVVKFLEKAQQEGSPVVKGLIEERRKKKEKQSTEAKAQKESQESKEFANAREVSEISLLRKKVNELAVSTPVLGHVLFPDDETVLHQLSTVSNKDSLISKCLSLRDVVQNISAPAREHGLNLEQARTYEASLDEQNLNKSLTAFFLYLNVKGVKVDASICGLKNVSKILSLLGAHQEDLELIPTLKKYSLLDFYHSENWEQLHKEILNLYSKALKSLSDAINSAREQGKSLEAPKL